MTTKRYFPLTLAALGLLPLGCGDDAGEVGEAGDEAAEDAGTDETETGEPLNPWEPGDPCWDEPIAGNFTIENADHLQAVGGYASIEGSLRISAGELGELSRLECLERVSGDLQLTWNEALTDLSGLSALTEVGGDLLIRHNANLVDLSALASVQGPTPTRVESRATWSSRATRPWPASPASTASPTSPTCTSPTTRP